MYRIIRKISLALAITMLMAGAGLAEEILQVPSSMRVLPKELFAGNGELQWVELPEGIEEIGERAFADSGIEAINLPSSLRYIAENAFEDTQLAAVSAVEGTYAYEWAVAHGYIVLDAELSASVKADSATAEAGEAVTWTVSASDNIGSCRYTFRLYRDGALVTEVGRGTDNTFTYVLDAPGAYRVECDVADAKTQITVSGGKVSVAAVVPKLSGRIDCDLNGASVGDTVNWTVRAEGGSGDYSYTYRLYRDGVLLYTTPVIEDPVLTYQFEKPATYYIACKVSDGSGTLVLKSEAITVASAGGDQGFAFEVTTEENKLSITQNQIWYVEPSGGVAPYRYSYTLTRGSDAVESQPYSENDMFGHTFFRTGDYNLNIRVRDSSGAVVSQDFPFSVGQGTAEVTGVIRMYVDTDGLGNILRTDSKTGHFELQLNNDSGDGIFFDNRYYENPVFSFGSAGGGAVTVFGAQSVSRQNAQLYTLSFTTTATKVYNLLNSILPNQYLNINAESENDIGYLYPSKKAYVIANTNCFTTVAAWCSALGDDRFSDIVSASNSYTDYIGWRIYDDQGFDWFYLGDF